MLFDMHYVLTDVRRNFNAYPDTGLEETHIFYTKLNSVPDCVWYWAALLRFVYSLDTQRYNAQDRRSAG